MSKSVKERHKPQCGHAVGSTLENHAVGLGGAKKKRVVGYSDGGSGEEELGEAYDKTLGVIFPYDSKKVFSLDGFERRKNDGAKEGSPF